MQNQWLRVGLALSLAVSCLAVSPVPAAAQAAGQGATAPVETSQVKVANGRLEGIVNPATGIRAFKGVPFAAPPVGDLRWQPPQPVPDWPGVRLAHDFGPRAMQQPLFGDMVFRSHGMSEDCLYLNIWSPAASGKAKLPVLVYFFGGGFAGGDGSEPRYDGERMAQKGIVAVTVTYRLGVFGFLAHPELTKESPHHASGNYGLLDQAAALQWVHKNIGAFGGDPKRVTIAGESAGSISVSAQMASPLSKGLIAGAIGESGSMLATLAPRPLKDAEAAGVKFASGLGLGPTPTLAALRAIPAEKLVQAPAFPGMPWCSPTVDGYFLPQTPTEIYTAGKQAHVPLLAGVNSEESGYGGVLGRDAPTVENYHKALQRLYGDKADAVFALYPATTDVDVMNSARELASDRFIAYGTWKWVDLATKTGGRPTYYYLFARARPSTPSSPPAQAPGAVHSAEIEYALGNLGLNQVYAWTPDDRKISQIMQGYFANFIQTANGKTADPNGPGLPVWPKFETGQRIDIDVNTHAESQGPLRARAALLNSVSGTLPAR